MRAATARRIAKRSLSESSTADRFQLELDCALLHIQYQAQCGRTWAYFSIDVFYSDQTCDKLKKLGYDVELIQTLSTDRPKFKVSWEKKPHDPNLR